MDDVIVVGGGPTGFLTALGLAQAGAKVRLIEADDDIAASPRAAVHHWAVLDGFARLGILDDCLAEGFAKQDYRNLVKSTGETIDFDMKVLEGRVAYPFNVHLGQHLLTRIVRRHFKRLGVAEFGTRFTGLAQDADGVTLFAEAAEGPREYRARWVVGSDGAASPVRKALGLAFDGMTWPERFVATNVRGDFAAHGYARATFVIDAEYGAVIVQIAPDGLWRFTYKEDASRPEKSYRERMPRVFAEMFKGEGEVTLDASAPYRMHQRCAERFRRGRVLLAGDAAHVTNPTGALGLTAGVFDAYALTPALAAVLDGAGDAILDRYDALRRENFLTMVSPRATANKQFVFHANGGGAALEAGLAELRRMRDDLDVRRERLMFLGALETPVVQPS
jgi:3-(3-hydroxy-phenyl)propionate hydroxylase/6-hydroxy-3-succinoylpyridine 3-monooxygenase